MINLSTIFQPRELSEPPPREAIAEAERKLGCPLPDQLQRFYRQTNGVSGAWTVTIFEVESLFERNETYHTIECLPHLIYFGNDNGNVGVFIPKLSRDLTVFESDLGDQDANSLIVLATSLTDWFERGCPWSDGAKGVKDFSTDGEI